MPTRDSTLETRHFLQTRLPSTVAEEMRLTAALAGITQARLYAQIVSGFLDRWRGRPLPESEFPSPPWKRGLSGAVQVNVQLPVPLAAEVLERTRARVKGEGVSTAAFLLAAVTWFRALSKADKAAVLGAEIRALPRNLPVRLSLSLTPGQARSLAALLGLSPRTSIDRLSIELAAALRELPES